MSIGEKILKARKEKGFTQEELAKLMGYKDRSTIARIESGDNDVPQSKVVEFSKTLGVPISYLMEWDECDDSRKEQLLIKHYQLARLMTYANLLASYNVMKTLHEEEGETDGN